MPASADSPTGDVIGVPESRIGATISLEISVCHSVKVVQLFCLIYAGEISIALRRSCEAELASWNKTLMEAS